jgi:hypothetical protein
MLGVVSPPGDHRKFPPAMDGVAVIVPEFPEQSVRLLTATVGMGLTVTVPCVEGLEQPATV